MATLVQQRNEPGSGGKVAASADRYVGERKNQLRHGQCSCSLYQLTTCYARSSKLENICNGNALQVMVCTRMVTGSSVTKDSGRMDTSTVTVT